MAVFKNYYNVDLGGKNFPRALDSMVCQDNVGGNQVGAYVYENGEAVALGGTCTGKVIRADGSTVALSGDNCVVSGNLLYVILTSQCYEIPGLIEVIVNSVRYSATTTIVKAFGTVERTTTGAVVPSANIPNLDQLLAQISAMQEATADAEAIIEMVADLYSASAAYSVGDYCIHDGGFYRCTTAISSPGEAWNSNHWTATNVADEIKNRVQTEAIMRASADTNILLQLAKAFDQSTPFAVGDYCIYQDELYVFTSAHAAGAWNSSQVSKVKLGNQVTDLKSAISKFGGDDDKLVNAVSAVIGNQMFNVEDWYLGNFTYNASTGWTYSDSTSAVLTKPGIVFPLEVGDVVKLSDYTTHRFRVSWRTNGVYSATDWKTTDYTISQAGDYIIQIANNPTATADLYDLLALLTIQKQDYVIKTINGNITTLRNDINNFGGGSNRLLNEFTKLTGNQVFNPEDWYNGNFTYNASTGWTYSDSQYSALTKPGVVFALKSGDIVKLSDYTAHQFRVSWRTNGVYSATDWKTTDYTISQDGDYIIQIANNPTAVADVITMLSLLSIIKATSTLNDINNDISSNAADIEKNENDIGTIKAFAQMFYNYPQDYLNIPVLLYANANIERIDVANGTTIIASTKHILTDYIEINPNRDLIISIPTGYVFNLLCYKSDKTYIARFGGQSFSVSTTFELYNETNYKTTGYIRVLINKSDNSDMTIEMGNSVMMFNGTVNKPGQSSTHLKVMTFNVGRYAWGDEPFYLTEEQYQQYIGNYKAFFGEQKPDILCLQENGQYFDADHNHSTGTELYQPLFPFNIDYLYATAIKSKWEFASTKNEDLSNGRWFSTAILSINGKSIFIGSTHLSVNNPTKRAEEFADIVTLTSDYDYCIIGMDSNIQSFTEIEALTNNGFKAANGGYFGWKYTYCSDPSDYSRETPVGEVLYLDNIFVKGNIIIDDIKVINEYSKLSSDHLPFVAYLTIY